MNQLEILLKLRNETAAGFAQLDKSVDQVKKQTDGLKTSTAAAAGGMSNMAKTALVAVGGLTALAAGAAFVVSSTREMLGEFGKAGSQLVDLKAKTGVGVVEMQKLQFAAKQSGVEFGSLTTALIQMEKAASKSPEKFAQLGITFEQVKNAKPDELFALVADGMANMSDQNDKARIALELFGRGGSEVLKMMTESFRALLEESEGTGLMTEEMAAKGDRLDDVFSKLDTVTKNLKVNLAGAFASPQMISMMEKGAKLIGEMAKNAETLSFWLKQAGTMGANFAANGVVNWFRMIANGGQMPEDFSGVTGGGSHTNVNVNNSVWGNADKVLAQNSRDSAKAVKEAWRMALSEMDAYTDAEVEGSHKAGQARAEAWRLTKQAMRDYIDAEVEGSREADAARKENFRALNQQIDEFNDAEARGSKDADASRVAKETERWRIAMDGVYIVADAIGGKFGGIVGAIGQMVIGLKAGADKFTTIANAAGQVGQIIGGKTGGFMSGAAGGAMAGFSASNGNPWVAAAGGLIGGIAGLFGGGKAQKKELADLKAQLSGLSDEAKKFGINLDSAFASKNSSVVKSAIESVNAAVKESEKRIAGLSTAAGGFNAFASGGGITDQASSDRAGLYAGAIFGGQVKESGDVVGALKSIGPALAEMAAKAKEFGYSLGAGVTNLLGMSGILDANGGLADQLSGLNQMMKGLGDAGMMTKDLFAAFGADASAVFGRLIAGGASGNQALALMQPTLQQLYEGQKLHGYAVDEATQALLDQAKAEGIVGDAFMSANERIVELLGILIEAVGGKLPEAYRRAGDAATDYATRASNLPGIPGGGYTGEDTGDGSGPGFASGTAFRNFGRGTSATLHGEEAVLTRPQVDRLVSMAVSGAPGSTVPQGGGRPIVIHNYLTMPDGRVLLTATTEAIRSEGRDVQEFRSALNGAR